MIIQEKINLASQTNKLYLFKDEFSVLYIKEKKFVVQCFKDIKNNISKTQTIVIPNLLMLNSFQHLLQTQ